MADPAPPETVLLWHVKAAHRGVVVWYFLTGIICLFGPDWWFGPTWSYFQQIPHGGHGLGYTCLGLAVMAAYALWRRKRRVLIWSLALGSTSFFVAAALISAQGIIGRMGLMESWFMLYAAVDIGLRGITLTVKP